MQRAVIFDLDGTLYDNRPLHWLLPLVELCCMRLGYLARERKARRQMRGLHYGTEEAFYAALFAAIDPKHPEHAERWYRNHYMPLQVALLRRFCHPFGWVKARLESLHRNGILVALYSDYGSAQKKIEALGIAPQYFNLIADAPSLGGLKPSALSARRLLAKLGIQPEECLIVGDRDDTDGETARIVGAQYEKPHI